MCMCGVLYVCVVCLVLRAAYWCVVCVPVCCVLRVVWCVFVCFHGAAAGASYPGKTIARISARASPTDFCSSVSSLRRSSASSCSCASTLFSSSIRTTDQHGHGAGDSPADARTTDQHGHGAGDSPADAAADAADGGPSRAAFGAGDSPADAADGGRYLSRMATHAQPVHNTMPRLFAAWW